MENKEFESGYAINGSWFVYGIKTDNKIYAEPKHLSKEFYDLLNFIENKFRDKILVPFQKFWIINSFMIYKGITPSYSFQCSFIDKDTALNVSRTIIDGIDNIIKDKAPVIIVIAEGDVKMLDDKYSASGMAYVRSGTFLESPEIWTDKWNENNRIFIIEDEYISRPIVEIKRYKDM